MALVRCGTQRSVSVDICTVLEEQTHNVDVAIERCESERNIVIRMHIGAVVKEQVRGKPMALTTGQPQCSVDACRAMHARRIIPHVQKPFNHIGVTVSGCHDHWEFAVSVHVCPILNEELDHS
jgi:hypothetical protein